MLSVPSQKTITATLSCVAWPHLAPIAKPSGIDRVFPDIPAMCATTSPDQYCPHKLMKSDEEALYLTQDLVNYGCNSLLSAPFQVVAGNLSHAEMACRGRNAFGG